MTPPPEDIDEQERELALLEAERLMETGNLKLDDSHYDEAISCFSDALQIYQSHNHRVGEGGAIGNLGNVYSRTGQNELALRDYKSSLAIAFETGNRRSMTINLCNLASVYKDLRRFEEAVEALEQTLPMSKEIGDKHQMAHIFGSMASIYRNQGHPTLSIQHHSKALDIFREIGNKSGEVSSLGNLALVLCDQGRFEEANDHFDQSIDLAEQIDNQWLRGIHLGNKGNLLMVTGDYNESEPILLEAIAICDETFLAAAGSFRGSLALLKAKTGDLENAYKLLEAAESQVKSHTTEYAKFTCITGQVCFLSGDTQGAQKALEEAKEIASEIRYSKTSALSQFLADLESLLE